MKFNFKSDADRYLAINAMTEKANDLAKIIDELKGGPLTGVEHRLIAALEEQVRNLRRVSDEIENDA